MVRILILLIALNAFITPVSAGDVCEMMDSHSEQTTSNNMPDMDCTQCDDEICSTVQCSINCSKVLSSVLLFEKQPFIIVAGQHQPQAGFAYFYTLVLPISKPPPLV